MLQLQPDCSCTACARNYQCQLIALLTSGSRPSGRILHSVSVYEQIAEAQAAAISEIENKRLGKLESCRADAFERSRH